MQTALTRDSLAFRTSAALAGVAALTAVTSFAFWGLFYRDVRMGVGNLRGTALTMLVIALPIMLIAMHYARRGSMRARLIWLGCLGYLAYNGFMLNFAAHFNSLFFLYTSLLGLSFWAILTLLRTFDLAAVQSAGLHIPVRPVAAFLIISCAAFAGLWIQAIVPAVIANSTPQQLISAGLSQNTVWVLDFAFTFPLVIIGALWTLERRAWGYIIAGTMLIMLTIETASIGIDQWFGHLHDPWAPMDAVPAMIASTAAGLLVSILFLRGIVIRSHAPATVPPHAVGTA
jgi:hypothetical protein